MIARGEFDRDAPGPKERPRRAFSRSLEKNIRGVISEMDLTRVEERRQTLENLKRISSLQLHDPVLEQFEISRAEEARRKRKLEGLVREMEDEFERLITDLERAA